MEGLIKPPSHRTSKRGLGFPTIRTPLAWRGRGRTAGWRRAAASLVLLGSLVGFCRETVFATLGCPLVSRSLLYAPLIKVVGVHISERVNVRVVPTHPTTPNTEAFRV